MGREERAIDIQQVEQKIRENVSADTLRLAGGVLGEPVKTVIDGYLTGFTLHLGGGVVLAVKPVGGTATLTMAPVQVTAASGYVKAAIEGTGANAGASADLTFTVDNNTVGLALKADMGPVRVAVKDLWQALDTYPFNELTLAKGKLDLETKLKPSFGADFSGQGALQFGSSEFDAALRVLYEDDSVGVLFGAAVSNIDLGDLWSVLEGITLEQTGLVFSSIAKAPGSLSDLGLIDNSKVPALAGFSPSSPSFEIKPGLTAFTTMKLDTGAVEALRPILPDDVEFSLYGNLQLADKDLTVIATVGGYRMGSAFTFDGLQLDWEVSPSDVKISLSTGGTLTIAQGEHLHLTDKGTLDVSAATVGVRLAVEDWTKPFGYDKLTVQELAVGLAVGGQAEGLSMTLAGSFQFDAAPAGSTTPDKFEFGIGGAIADFEVPTGLVFILKEDSPGQQLTLGSLIDGITSVDLRSIPVMEAIDEVLQLEEIEFWAIEGQSVEIHGKTYDQGFGINADVTLFEKWEEVIEIDVKEKASPPAFSGELEMKNAVEIGSVLKLYRYDVATKQPDTSKGPIFFVSSQPKTVDGIEDAYFYTSAYVEFLDVVKAFLYAQVTKDGIKFVEKVSAGDQSQHGTFLSEEIHVTVSRSQLAFDAGFEFGFGFEGVNLGGFTVAGIHFPDTHLAAFHVRADVSIAANVKAGTFDFAAGLDFEFMGYHLDPHVSFHLDLSEALTSLEELGSHILHAITEELPKWLADQIGQVAKKCAMKTASLVM